MVLLAGDMRPEVVNAARVAPILRRIMVGGYGKIEIEQQRQQRQRCNAQPVCPSFRASGGGEQEVEQPRSQQDRAQMVRQRKTVKQRSSYEPRSMGVWVYGSLGVRILLFAHTP